MRYLILFFFIPLHLISQEASDYWSWLEVITNSPKDDITSFFEFQNDGEFTENKSYGDIGFFFQKPPYSYVISKNYNEHILSGGEGNTYRLMVTRDDLDNVNSVVNSLITGYFNKDNSFCYATLSQNNVNLSSGKLDDNPNVKGVQFNFLSLIDQIDFSENKTELDLMFFNDHELNETVTISIKLNQHGYYGYDWIIQLSGETWAMNEFLSKMPKAPKGIQCSRIGAHAYLTLQVGRLSKIPIKGLFDTGASLLSIDQSTARELIQNEDARIVGESDFHTANGTVRQSTLMINQISVQGFTFYNVEATITNSSENLIGQSLLEGTNWTFSNGQAMIFIK
jgi:hypothetical protein